MMFMPKEPETIVKITHQNSDGADFNNSQPLAMNGIAGGIKCATNTAVNTIVRYSSFQDFSADFTCWT
jgi:hypothetical protein